MNVSPCEPSPSLNFYLLVFNYLLEGWATSDPGGAQGSNPRQVPSLQNYSLAPLSLYFIEHLVQSVLEGHGNKSVLFLTHLHLTRQIGPLPV